MIELFGTAKSFLLGGWKWIAAIVACSALSWLHGCGYGIDRTHNKYASQALEAATTARSASEGATATKDKRDVAFDAQQKELENAAKSGSNEPVGTGVTGVLDGMRRQQKSDNR